MTALVILCAAVVLIVAGISAKHNGDRVIDELLAAEQRQIAREKARGYDANLRARWHS